MHAHSPGDARLGIDQRWDATYAPAAAAIVIAVTITRIVLLAQDPLNLYFDEAQYWVWAQTPAFGYFSKPPLIAWIISGTTSIFGDSEFAVRVGSPLIHALTSWLVFVLGRDLYNSKVGFWSSVLYLTLPAVIVSSAVISTDVPLLAAWAAALIALDRTIKRECYGWAAATGAAIGVGLLAKYAMGYFGIGVLAYAALSKNGRSFLFSGRSVVAMAIAALVISPNILWNSSHGFATVTHTASNANWGGNLFNWDELLDFLASQFGVFGPLLTMMLIFGLATLGSRLREAGKDARSDIFLLAFSLPILGIVAGQAFVSRANANWAAPAYVGAIILVTAWALRIHRSQILTASLVLHLTLGAALYAAALSPSVTAALDAIGSKRPVSNSFKRMRGWDDLGRIVATTTASRRYSAILSDDREDIAELFYYVRPRTQPILMWDDDGVPEDHFELAYPLKDDPGGPVLFVSRRADAARVTAAFDKSDLIAEISIDIGGGRTREFRLYDLQSLRRSPGSPPS